MMDINAVKTDILSRFHGMRMQRPAAKTHRTKSVRITPETYLLARIYAEANDMTIRDAIAHLVSLAMMHVYKLEGVDSGGSAKPSAVGLSSPTLGTAKMRSPHA